MVLDEMTHAVHDAARLDEMRSMRWQVRACARAVRFACLSWPCSSLSLQAAVSLVVCRCVSVGGVRLQLLGVVLVVELPLLSRDVCAAGADAAQLRGQRARLVPAPGTDAGPIQLLPCLASFRGDACAAVVNAHGSRPEVERLRSRNLGTCSSSFCERCCVSCACTRVQRMDPFAAAGGQQVSGGGGGGGSSSSSSSERLLPGLRLCLVLLRMLIPCCVPTSAITFGKLPLMRRPCVAAAGISYLGISTAAAQIAPSVESSVSALPFRIHPR